jgi:transposase InsO family protein
LILQSRTANAHIESLNGKIHDELRNAHSLLSIFQAPRKAAEWLADYNDVRPPSALGYLTPREFADRFKTTPPSVLSVELTKSLDSPEKKGT